MQRVEDEPMETIHLYVVRETEKRPYSLLPLFFASLCLVFLAALTLYSAEHPAYEQKRLTLPAQFLPLKVFTAVSPVIPTGTQIYPATTAHGMLTLTNGSVIAQTLPSSLLFTTSTGIEVQTDSAVFVPAGSANGYGVAAVSAHAVISGKAGNIPAYAINQVEGSSIYIRNLSTFQGGKDRVVIRYSTPADRKKALDLARITLKHSVHMQAILASPCQEHIADTNKMVVSWNCQFVNLPHMNIPHARIIGVTLHGKNLLVDVIFVARPVMNVYR